MHPVYRPTQPTGGPTIPEVLSHSTLTAIERCPRQWWLQNAKYDRLPGPYPQRPSAAAVFGTIVHHAVERFSRTLRSEGSPRYGTDEFRAARIRFPVRAVVQRLRRDALARLADNPRVNFPVIERSLAVDACVDEFKRLVIRTFAADEPGTAKLDAQMPSAAAIAAPRRMDRRSGARSLHLDQLGSAPLPIVLPEVYIEIADPPIRGIIDLVIVNPDGDTLIEFKTGAPRPEHRAQLDVYAAMWWIRTLRPIRQRRILYSDDTTDEIGAASVMELESQRLALRSRVANVRSLLKDSPPLARPSAEGCTHCGVRQLCEAYWNAHETADLRWDVSAIRDVPDDAVIEGWHDLELHLGTVTATGNHLLIHAPYGKGALLSAEAPLQFALNLPGKFYPGDVHAETQIRLLNVGLRRKGSVLHITMTQLSEVFWKSDLKAVE